MIAFNKIGKSVLKEVIIIQMLIIIFLNFQAEELPVFPDVLPDVKLIYYQNV